MYWGAPEQVLVFRGAPEELTAKSYNHYIFYCNNIIASVRVKNPRHVTLFYASRAKKLLGKMFKLNPGFDWLEKEIASHASHVKAIKVSRQTSKLSIYAHLLFYVPNLPASDFELQFWYSDL